MLTERYFVVVKRIVLILFLYLCCRILFYIINYKSFEEADAGTTLLAFLYGVRFDLSIIFSSNLPFILLSILPLAFTDTNLMQRILKILYLLVNIPLLFMNLADTEYFKFTHKRTGFDVLGISGDIQSQGVQLAFHYWHIPLITFLFSYVLFRLYDQVSKSDKKIVSWQAWVILAPVIAISVLIIRGGFQYKPLKPDHAFVLNPNVLGNLVLNTPYNFFTTMSFPRAENVNYYKSDVEVRAILKKNYVLPDSLNKNTNIVVIILESFSREYMGINSEEKGYTPFLDSLARQGLFFDHHFANGKRSVEAVPSIFASIPSLMNESYITGVYQGNELHGLAEALGKNGYYTGFFHGGRNGTMGFDKFSINAGFHEYNGLDEYPDKEKDYDGNWGIYDEPYLLYFCDKISTFRKPFMASVFTLSSHQPYSVPNQYRDKFPKGNLEIHESIGYADHALRQFFEKASQKDWYKNTLFVITADHTQGLTSKKYKNPIGEHRVPLILFHPGKQIVADTSLVSEHIDIMPTVLDYVGVKRGPSLLFGNSLLQTKDGCAIFFTDNTYYYFKKDFFIEFNSEHTWLYRSTDWNKKKRVKDNLVIQEQMLKELKAYIQYYNNGLNSNNWYRLSAGN